MSQNIEIKAFCPDKDIVLDVINRMNLPFKGSFHQTDTFYNVPKGRLKLREDKDGARLIPYIRKNQKGPRTSSYVLLPVDDPDITSDILEEMFGIRSVVEKKRQVWMYDNVRIHLDVVEGLGTYIELEGIIDGHANGADTLEKVELLMELLHITEEHLVSRAYVDLLEAARASQSDSEH